MYQSEEKSNDQNSQIDSLKAAVNNSIVIIPAYNEAENIVKTVSAVVSAGFNYVVVNDGSSDDTLDVCKKNNINVLDLPQNLGIGGAVQAGFKYAYHKGYEIAIQFDGDGQHDARFLRQLVKGILAGNDMVIGSRFLENTGGFKSTFMRRVGIVWLSKFLRILFKINITDATSGFRGCNANALKFFCKYYPVDYPEPEAIAWLAKYDYKIAEIPVIMHERTAGTSSIGMLSSVYYMIKVTLSILIARIGKKRY